MVKQFGEGGCVCDPGCHVISEGSHLNLGVPRVRGKAQFALRGAHGPCPVAGGDCPERRAVQYGQVARQHVGKRRAGKSDAIDAVRAARELLARPHPAQMRADGDREALRLLMIDRDNAVKSAKTARTALAAILVTAPRHCASSSALSPANAGPANAPR
jgi:hypothetical protein